LPELISAVILYLKNAISGYPYAEEILKPYSEGDKCAIKRHQEPASLANGKDHAAHRIVTQISNDESEHEQVFENRINYINIMNENFKKMRD